MFKYLLSGLGACFMAGAVQAADLENILYMDLKDGRVVIEMSPDLAPNHVSRIKELARSGFYDGVVFHRVIDGFMAQTGDPTGTGMGGSGKKLNAEFSDAPHVRGTVSMARPGDVNGADSQFFIMLDNHNSLDGQYTVWGKVTEGMEHVDGIKKGGGSPALNGKVDDPDKIISLRVAADMEESNAADANEESKPEDSKDTASESIEKPADKAAAVKVTRGAAGLQDSEADTASSEPTAQEEGTENKQEEQASSQEEIRPEDAEPAAGGQKVIYVPKATLNAASESAENIKEPADSKEEPQKNEAAQ